MQDTRPLVDVDEQFERGIIREGAITHSLRRRQVEEYDDETAPKQARLRDISEHHLFRKRTIAPSVDDSSSQVAMVHNAAVVTTHRHVVEILRLQKFKGAYYNSLNNDQKENIKAQIEGQMGGNLKKIHKVARAVQGFVGKGDFEEFVRYMYSVSRFEDEIEFNYVHPQVLLPIIMPTFRNML